LVDSACNTVAISKNSDETPKFVALIEGDDRVVLGVDFRAPRACGSVHDERTAKSLSLLFLIDGEMAD